MFPQSKGASSRQLPPKPDGRGFSTPWLEKASLSQHRDELFLGYLCLTEKASEGADLDLAVHRNHTTLGAALHDDMAAALPYLLKTKLFEDALDLSAGKVG
jgi:hypothetical protein